jgi:hypothetical protein
MLLVPLMLRHRVQWLSLAPQFCTCNTLCPLLGPFPPLRQPDVFVRIHIHWPSPLLLRQFVTSSLRLDSWPSTSQVGTHIDFFRSTDIHKPDTHAAPPVAQPAGARPCCLPPPVPVPVPVECQFSISILWSPLGAHLARWAFPSR